MLIRVIDFETTGLPPDAAICEAGWCDVHSGGIVSPISRLANPGRPIPIEAMAVHHITDADVARARSPDAVLIDMTAGPVDIWCAHNADFEKAFFTGAGTPWICTYKVALRLWPDAPSHSNQVLRYFLKTECDPDLASPPHRAGPDAYVTAHILAAALREATVEQMIAWSSEPALLVRCGFGKHRGAKWEEIPVDYLIWMVKQDMDAAVIHTAKHHLSLRAA